MSAQGCFAGDLPPRLGYRQRAARAAVSAGSLGIAVLTARRAGRPATIVTAGAGWFGASHVVAALTRYPGCPELGAVPGVLLRREVHVGCAPWRVVDQCFGLTR